MTNAVCLGIVNRWLLSCVAQAGGNAVDGEDENVAQGFGLGAFGIGQGAQAAKRLDLQEVERVDVWIAQLYRALNDGVGIHEVRVAGSGEYGLTRALVLVTDTGEVAL